MALIDYGTKFRIWNCFKLRIKKTMLLESKFHSRLSRRFLLSHILVTRRTYGSRYYTGESVFIYTICRQTSSNHWVCFQHWLLKCGNKFVIGCSQKCINVSLRQKKIFNADPFLCQHENTLFCLRARFSSLHYRCVSFQFHWKSHIFFRSMSESLHLESENISYNNVR